MMAAAPHWFVTKLMALHDKMPIYFMQSQSLSMTPRHSIPDNRGGVRRQWYNQTGNLPNPDEHTHTVVSPRWPSTGAVGHKKPNQQSSNSGSESSRSPPQELIWTNANKLRELWLCLDSDVKMDLWALEMEDKDCNAITRMGFMNIKQKRGKQARVYMNKLRTVTSSIKCQK